MHSTTILILAALILNFSPMFAQGRLDSLVPQPRQAYLKNYFTESFRLSTDKIIMLTDSNPDFEAALKFNEKLRYLNLDTLKIYLVNHPDSLKPGIILSGKNDLVNSILSKAPGQRVRLTDSFPGSEGYLLDIIPENTVIAASDKAGMHYGIKRFFELLEVFKSDTIAPLRVIDQPEFPVRWIRYSNNLSQAANMKHAKEVWDSAAKYNVNGISFGGANARWIRMPVYQFYVDSLVEMKKFASDRNMKIIPYIMPIGSSGGPLRQNPNLASGLPVQKQKFVFEADTGRLIPKVDINPANGGFENYDGNTFPGFGIDKPGEISFADTIVKHSGKASIRFQDFQIYDPGRGYGRIIYTANVKPFTLYHVSGRVKTENFSRSGNIRTYANGRDGNCAYFSVSVPSTTDGWQKIDYTVNSMNNDIVYFYWGVWQAQSGKIWWDDLKIEEIPFINLLRRDGAPLTVTDASGSRTYTEGTDFDTLRDPLLGNDSPNLWTKYHEIPQFKRLLGGNLRNGDTVLASYYHAGIIANKLNITLSHPETYNILEKDFKTIDSVMDAENYFMVTDEIRTMNWDEGDLSRGMTPGEILADAVQKCADIIEKHSPDAEYWAWSDMFDEYHNAVESDYYMVNGDLRGSADLIPKELGIVNWNHREQDSIVFKSLNFFESRGFRQIAAVYYGKDENQIRRWKEWVQNTDNVSGMMYTTFDLNAYGHLEPFGEYAWNHAPYIYHTPPLEFNDRLTLQIKIAGDKWDSGWKPDSVYFFYRTNPLNNFIKMNVDLSQYLTAEIDMVLDEDVNWIQYYFYGLDNRGWAAKIPFGENRFFELGEFLTNISGLVITEGNLPLQDVEMELVSDKTQKDTTNEKGEFLFDKIPSERDYKLIPKSSIYDFHPPEKIVELQYEPVEVTFTAYPKEFSCSGYIFDEKENKISDIQIILTGGGKDKVFTDAGGHYEFRGLSALSSYTVTPSDKIFYFIPGYFEIKDMDGNKKQDFRAKLKKFNISGKVCYEKKIPADGITVLLSGFSDDVTQTNSAGEYFFKDLTASKGYSIKPEKKYFESDPDSYIIDELISDTTVDFYLSREMFSIYGYVKNKENEGIEDVEMNLAGFENRSVFTNNSGSYRIDQLSAGGKYFLIPHKENYEFSPRKAVVNANETDTVINFTADSILSSIDLFSESKLNNKKIFIKNIFPNPFNKNFICEFYVSKPDKISVRIKDMLGRTVEKIISNKLHNSGYFIIDYHGNISNGIYYIVIENSENRVIGMLIRSE